MSVGIYKMTTKDVMTKRADTIRDDESIHTAIEAMINLGLSALPVVTAEGECVGVLTKTDIVKLTGALEHEGLNERRDLAALFFGVDLESLTNAKVEDVMTTYVLSVREDDPLTVVAEKLLRHEVHHLPVCDENNQILGMVSSMDLVRAIQG